CHSTADTSTRYITLILCIQRSTILHLAFFFHDTAPTEIYTLSLHDALPISTTSCARRARTTLLPDAVLCNCTALPSPGIRLAAEIGRAHVELQSRGHLVCRLLLEKKKKHSCGACPRWASSDGSCTSMTSAAT